MHFELRFPNEKEQASLMINPDTPIYDFIRLRLLNGEPMSLDATVMPLNLVPGLNKTHLESSVFRYVQETLGLKDHGIVSGGAGAEAQCAGYAAPCLRANRPGAGGRAGDLSGRWYAAGVRPLSLSL